MSIDDIFKGNLIFHIQNMYMYNVAVVLFCEIILELLEWKVFSEHTGLYYLQCL